MSDYNYEGAKPFLESIKAGNSVFRFIPDDIGEFVYCFSTNSKDEPDSEETVQTKQVLSIIIPLVIALVCWLFFYEYVRFCAIVSVVMAFIALMSFTSSKHFDGKDFFVGTEGYAVIEFKETRDNVIAKKIHYFREIDDLLSAVEDEYSYDMDKRSIIDKRHDATHYQFIAYSPQKGNKRHIVDHYYDKFSVSLFPDLELYFWKWVEATWSKYKFAQIREAYDKGEAIGFNAYSTKGYTNNYIMLKGEEIAVGGVVFNLDNTQDISIDDAQLVIKHKNYKSFLGGVFKSGDKTVIPLHDIGNRDLFSKIFIAWKKELYRFKSVDSFQSVVETEEQDSEQDFADNQPVDDPNHIDLFRAMVVTEEIDDEEMEEENAFEDELTEEDFDPLSEIGSVLSEDEIGSQSYKSDSWIWNPPQVVSNTGWNKKLVWTKPKK